MLTPENCIGIMLIARDYYSRLEEGARCFVMRNFLQVSQQSDELLELLPEELQTNEVVWDGILRWVDHDENRKGNIVKLTKNDRLGLLNPKFVLENVRAHPCVAGNDECCAIIMDAHKYLLGLEMTTQKEGKSLIESLPDHVFRMRSYLLLEEGQITGL
ncbi:hypothetical protein B7P43_G17849 [Cryptotermes secundus]|uniref:BACK domain-containing protein n=1 Tax=Cryptotermes secundus TaxID=105785 RepID=A0A2J7PKF8_9NEOP|nr:hypothetical protein B7P43_G17849 [Cryptotermes secundus]